MSSRPPNREAKAASRPGRKRSAPVVGVAVLAALTLPVGVRTLNGSQELVDAVSFTSPL
jgi:hypothetical protein